MEQLRGSLRRERAIPELSDEEIKRLRLELNDYGHGKIGHITFDNPFHLHDFMKGTGGYGTYEGLEEDRVQTCLAGNGHKRAPYDHDNRNYDTERGILTMLDEYDEGYSFVGIVLDYDWVSAEIPYRTHAESGLETFGVLRGLVKDLRNFSVEEHVLKPAGVVLLDQQG